MTDQQKVREAFPRYAAYQHLRSTGTWPSGVPEWAKNHEGHMDEITLRNAVIEELAQAAIAHASSASAEECSVDARKAFAFDALVAVGHVSEEQAQRAFDIAEATNPQESSSKLVDARDALRWRALCELIDSDDTVYTHLIEVINDAFNLGSGALERHIDQAIAGRRGEAT
ncbi:hypothetical protein ISN75_06625 [Dyella marensis]|uniref:hypothetical protein n=1 Tax=Dyella marensis TaxID=500610 RepID=UPI0031DE2D6F